MRPSEKLDLCRSRVLQLERCIETFLKANDAGEMGNRDRAIQRMRNALAQRRETFKRRATS